jgi:adenylate cyclase
MGYDFLYLGLFEKSLEYFEKAIRLSPHDPSLGSFYNGKAQAYFALKQYDQAIEWAGRAIAVNANNPIAQGALISAIAMTGHEANAHEALQRFLALPPGGLRTIAEWKAFKALHTDPHSDPTALDFMDRRIEGLRKAGMPEE